MSSSPKANLYGHTLKGSGSSVWESASTLLELLNADGGATDEIILLKTLILKRFNLTEIQVFHREHHRNHIEDLIRRQTVGLGRRQERHFRAMMRKDSQTGVIVQEQLPTYYWFLLRPREGVTQLYLGEGECQLSQVEFQRLQVMLLCWEQWRGLRAIQEKEMRLRKQLSSIKGITDRLSRSYERDGVLLEIIETAMDLVGARAGYIFIYHPENGLLDVRWVRGLRNAMAEEQVNKGNLPLEGVRPGEGLVGRVFKTRKAIREDLQVDLPTIEPSTGLLSTLCVPLSLDNEVLGVIRLTGEDRSFDETDQDIIEIMAVNVSSVLKRALLFEQTITDHLTGLNLRQHFEKLVDAELSRAHRYKHPTSMMMIDIDHFKKVNDTWGHQMGDEVLKNVAHTIREGLRQIDHPARLGGEEFAVLLPSTSAQNALFVAERLRQKVKDMSIPLPQGGEVKVTISLGIADAILGERCHYDELYRLSDEALYKSKHTGRDRITISSREQN